MRIIKVVITNEVNEKIEAKHGVTFEEASEALLNAKYLRKVGGKQYKAIGKTKAGRCLAVFYKYYQEIAEITSARDVDKKASPMLMVYCVDCEVEMEAIKANFTFKEGKIVVKDLPAYKCPKCSKVVFEVATISHAKKILEDAIEVKPIKFDRKLDFDGKSLIMRIPKQIQAALNLKKGKKLKMWIRDEKHVMLEL